MTKHTKIFPECGADASGLGCMTTSSLRARLLSESHEDSNIHPNPSHHLEQTLQSQQDTTQIMDYPSSHSLFSHGSCQVHSLYLYTTSPSLCSFA